jgi:putative ABC transport system permease protein
VRSRLSFHARWGWRLLVREPTRHVVICSMLAAVTLGLTFVAALLWHATRPPVAAVGSAATELILADNSKQSLSRGLQAVRREHLRPVVVLEEPVTFPGATTQLPLRNQPLGGALGGRAFTILEGRLPHGRREMVVTPTALEVLRTFVGPRTARGALVEVGPDRSLKIVGIVRDPRDHHTATMFVDDSVQLAARSASVYTRASIERLRAFQTDNPSVLSLVTLSEPASDDVVSLSLLLALGALMIAGLLAAVTYAVSARRRLREYGMLGAIGATSRQITATITAVGVVTSTVAAVPGALIGYALVSVGAAWLEAFLGRDLPADAAPLWIVMPPMLAMVCVATVAARRPARAIARIPVVDALAARRPTRAYSARGTRLAPLAVILAALAYTVGAARDVPLLLFSAPLLTLVALLLVAPLLVRLVGRSSSLGPTAWRFGLRDLARKPGPSLALLAGLTVLLTAPASLAVLTASAEHQRGDEPPNLPANMMLIEESVGGLGGWSSATPNRRGAEALLRRLRARLPQARTSAIRVPVAAGTPVNRSEYGPRHPVLETVWAVQRRQRPPKVRSDTPIWIATPRLMDLLTARGRPASATPDILSDNAHTVAFRTPTGRAVGDHRPAELGAPEADLLAGVWIAPRYARHRGWRAHTAGWILVNDRAITPGVLRDAAAAAHPAFRVSGADGDVASPFPARLVLLAACLAALLVALVVLALERLELERDVRVFTAIGARERLLRQMVGARTGVLTAIASLCAILVGYSVWLANRLFSSEEPPLAVSIDLVLVAVALPLVLAAMSIFVRPPPSRE